MNLFNFACNQAKTSESKWLLDLVSINFLQCSEPININEPQAGTKVTN